MNVLYLFGFDVGIGGHYKSGSTFARFLVDKGHYVLVFSKRGNKEAINDLFLKKGINFISVDNFDYSSHRNLKYLLYQIVKKNRIDVIHVQDIGILSLGYLVSILAKCGLVYSQAGGHFQNRYPPSKAEFVVFSQELLDSYKKIKEYKKRNIEVVRERIDVSTYYPFSSDKYFKNKYSLPEGGVKFLVAMRLEVSKRPWIDSILSISEKLKSQSNIYFIIAGVGDQLTYFRSKADNITKKAKGRTQFIFVGAIYSEKEMAKIFNYSDFFIGNGRGLMEAMCCGTNVIVVGEHGECQLVKENNIKEIAYYNFSGRHFRFSNTDINSYIEILNSYINDNNKLKHLSCFVQRYSRNNLSGIIGANKLEAIYERSLAKKKKVSDYYWWKCKINIIELASKIKNKIRIIII